MRNASVAPLTFADLLEQIGDVAPHRIRLRPPPGKATEEDVVAIHDREKRLYELVDGVLVEKVMGYAEASLATRLGHFVQSYLDHHDLGNLAGADGTVRLMPRLVRIPDLSFVSWDKLPGRVLPRKPIPDLVPDLAVEVLSEGNTKSELARKLRDYFLCGVRRVWFVDPRHRSVQVYTAPDEKIVLKEKDTLDGGDVLPGFMLPLRDLFVRLPHEPEQTGTGGGKRRKSTRKPRS